jgi:amino acid transporter
MSNDRGAAGAGLGTFVGVYTPSILTILGVVLFLRTGWVVGSVGLVPALGIILLAHVITVATALSVSAIATNMRVGAGGAYYIVSRSLGIEIGGAVGVPLFLAQTFSVALYAFGLVESLELFWPGMPARPTAAGIVIAVTLISLRGAQAALRMQIPIMAAIGVALVSLFTGAAMRAERTLPLFAEGGTEDFWIVFAVFFPAVTGLMAGVSLSGELRDPASSIVRGTLASVGTGLIVYLAVPVALALAADPETLRANNLIWFEVAAVPLLIYPGLFGAVFSSAVGSILGAPQTLEALSRDGVLPRLPRTILGRDVGNSPALLFSAAVALAAVGLGDLDAVAPILTMFFLTTYGVINLVAGLEQLSGAPSYRPRLRVPWWVSLLGALGCVGVMLLINPWAAVLAFVIEIGVYTALRRRALSAAWGDLRHGALLSLVRTCLIALRRMPADPRNWRPHILLLANDPRRRLELVRFADWLNQRRGILTVAQLLEGDLAELAESAQDHREEINDLLDEEGIVAFAETDIVTDFVPGAVSVAQANGIAGLSSNTIMFGWADRRERLLDVMRVVEQVARLGKSGVICRIVGRRWGGEPRRIDVWWRGLQHNGDLLLLFAHLLSLNAQWRGVRIHIKTIVSGEMMAETTTKQLDALIERNRIDATARVIGLQDGDTVQDTIQRESRDADVVFMGLPELVAGREDATLERLESLVGDLPTVIFVRAAGSYAGELLEQPEANGLGASEPATGTHATDP